MSWPSTLTSISDEPKLQRDMPVSTEILAVVEVIKKHMSEQKKIRDEFNSLTTKPLENLSFELAELQQEVTFVSSALRKHSVQAAHLSEEMLNLERSFGMVKKSPDTLYSGSQDTPALMEYFNSCLASFALRVQTYKQEIQAIEELISSRAKPSLTPKELAEVLRKLDEQFISLAALLYTVNEDVCSAKAQFTRKYRTVLDEKSLFDQENSATSSFDLLPENDFLKSSSLNRTPYGPSPFNLSSSAAFPLVPTQQSGNNPISTPFSQPFSSLSSASSQIPASSGAGAFSLIGSSAPSSLATTSSSAGSRFSLSTGIFNKFGAVPASTIASGFNLQPSTTNLPSFGFGSLTTSTTSPFISKGPFGK